MEGKDQSSLCAQMPGDASRTAGACSARAEGAHGNIHVSRWKGREERAGPSPSLISDQSWGYDRPHDKSCNVNK